MQREAAQNKREAAQNKREAAQNKREAAQNKGPRAGLVGSHSSYQFTSPSGVTFSPWIAFLVDELPGESA